MSDTEWIPTTERFVLFFDILGFKDMVQSNTHEHVLEKFKKIKQKIAELDLIHEFDDAKKLNILDKQTRSATFSDSIIFFSKGNTAQDAMKILVDAHTICMTAIENNIALKGAISYGRVTVDFENSIFFGKPIIDAFLLHENLQMLTVILDHNFEVQFDLLTPSSKELASNKVMVNYKANLKNGKTTHTIIRPSPNMLINAIKTIKTLYKTVSGYPRIYIDNTIEFFESLKTS